MSKKMSKGYEAQDRVLAGFRRAAKSSNINSAVARAMRDKKKVKPQKDEEVVFSPLALNELYNG